MPWSSSPYTSLPLSGTDGTVVAYGAQGVTGSTTLEVYYAGTAVAVGPELVQVTFTGTPVPSPVTFTVTGPGGVFVLEVTPQLDGTFLVVVPGMLPLQMYAMVATSGDIVVIMPYQALASYEPLGMKLLEALTYALGKECQEHAGAPETYSTHPLNYTDTVLRVRSTLGFPVRGWVRLGAMLLEYTSKTATTLTLRVPTIRYPEVNAQTRVLLAVEYITPEGANFGSEVLG